LLSHLVGDIPIGDIPIGDIPIGDIPIGDIPIGDIPPTLGVYRSGTFLSTKEYLGFSRCVPFPL
ncbi:MAG: hypothetical protein ACYC4H_14670, partial [Desulfocucumaceae bacterium]